MRNLIDGTIFLMGWLLIMAAVIWIMERAVILCGIMWSMRGVIM